MPSLKSCGTSTVRDVVVGASSYMLLSHLDFLLNGSHGLKMCDLIVAAGLAVVSFRWWRHSVRARFSGTKMAQPSIGGHRFVSATNPQDSGLLKRIRLLRKGPIRRQGGTNLAPFYTGTDDDDGDDDVDDDHCDDGYHSPTSKQRMFETDVKEVITACRDADLELAERLVVQLVTAVHNDERKGAGQTARQTMAHAIIESCLQAGDVHRAARWVDLIRKGGMPLHPRSIYVVLGSLIQKAEFRSALMFLFDLAVAGAPADLACFERVLEHCISSDGPTSLEDWLEQVSRCGSRPSSLAYAALIGSPRHVSKVAHAEYWFDHACKAGVPGADKFSAQSCVPALVQKRIMLHKSGFKSCSTVQRIVHPLMNRYPALTCQSFASSSTYLPNGEKSSLRRSGLPKLSARKSCHQMPPLSAQ